MFQTPRYSPTRRGRKPANRRSRRAGKGRKRPTQSLEQAAIKTDGTKPENLTTHPSLFFHPESKAMPLTIIDDTTSKAVTTPPDNPNPSTAGASIAIAQGGLG